MNARILVLLFLFLAGLVAAKLAAQEWETETWDYDRLMSESDLVVIAQPNGFSRPGETITLDDWSADMLENRQDFNIDYVLKGDPIREITLLYFLPLQSERNGMVPALFRTESVRFSVGRDGPQFQLPKPTYLLYLRQVEGTEYELVTGRTRPVAAARELVSPIAVSHEQLQPDQTRQTSQMVQLDIQFEIIMSNVESQQRLSPEEMRFATSAEELTKMKPHESFVKLQDGSIEKEFDGNSDVFFVGRLEGELYSCDTFEFVKAIQSDDTVVACVRYIRRQSSAEPVKAMAYFKARVGSDIENLQIQFEQRDETFSPLASVDQSLIDNKSDPRSKR